MLSLSESWGLCERRKEKGEEAEEEIEAAAAVGETTAVEKNEDQDGEVRSFVVLLVVGIVVVVESDQPKGRKWSSSGKVLTLFRATASDAGFVNE
jgi:hypothetical protein